MEALMLSGLTAIALVLLNSHLVPEIPSNATSVDLVAIATETLQSIDKDPSQYHALIVHRDPDSESLGSRGQEDVPGTVLFIPKKKKDHALWVSSVKGARVEWWFGDRALTKYQVRAINAAAAAAFPGLAEGYNPRRYGLRAFERTNCLVFLFYPRLEQSADKWQLAPDHIVALDRAKLNASEPCESEINRVDRLSP